MGVFACLHVCMWTTYMQCLWESEDGIRSFRTKVTYCCVLLHGCWKSNLLLYASNSSFWTLSNCSTRRKISVFRNLPSSCLFTWNSILVTLTQPAHPFSCLSLGRARSPCSTGPLAQVLRLCLFARGKVLLHRTHWPGTHCGPQCPPVHRFAFPTCQCPEPPCLASNAIFIFILFDKKIPPPLNWIWTFFLYHLSIFMQRYFF